MERHRQRELFKAMRPLPLGRQQQQQKQQQKSSQEARNDSSADEMNISAPRAPIATSAARQKFKPHMKPDTKERNPTVGANSVRPTNKKGIEEDTRRRAQNTKPLPGFRSKDTKLKDPQVPDKSKVSSSKVPAGISTRSNSNSILASRASTTAVDDAVAVSSLEPEPFPMGRGGSESPPRMPSEPPSTNPKSFPMDNDGDISPLGRSVLPPDKSEPASAVPVPRTPSPLRRKVQEEPQPFPMSPTTPVDSARTIKRGSSSNLMDDVASFKRPKYDDTPEEFQNDSIIHDAEFERDRLMMEPVDPKTLCAFCDEPWPKDPSKELTDLFARIRPRAWRQPRYQNACGLQAPVEVFIDLCNMHRNETSVIPEGLAQGWPSEIDFDAVPQRLWKLKSKLEKIIKHPAGGYFYEMAKTDIKEMGGLVMGSMRGQFAAFQKTQPGYYGERGLFRIYQALRDLFPLLGEERSCTPLDQEAFMMRVLVPEAACLLIQEDLQLPSHAEALDVLQRSQKYGLAKFPDRGEEDGIGIDKLGVGMRVRLKLGQERMEADLAQARKEVDAERSAQAKTKRLAKDKGEDRNTDTDPSKKGKSKGKAKEKARELSASMTTASFERASSLIDLSSDAEVCTTIDHVDEVTILGRDKTRRSKTPTTKRRVVKGRKRKTPSISESSTDIEMTGSQFKPRRRSKKQGPTLQNTSSYTIRSRSASVTSLTTSVDAEVVEWTTNLRDNDDLDTESSQEL